MEPNSNFERFALWDFRLSFRPNLLESYLHYLLHLFFLYISELWKAKCGLIFVCRTLCNKYQNNLRKQPSWDVLGKRCFENMQQIYRRTPIPKCDFNKVANKLHSGMDVLPYVCYIFSEHLWTTASELSTFRVTDW